MRGPVLLTLAALTASGCAPLTFSNDGSVDFDRYRSVLVTEVHTDANLDGAAYLARELATYSGFEQVTTDPRERVDLVLRVDVRVRRIDTVHSDGFVDVSYESHGTFRALSAGQQEVDSGEVEDTSESEVEAVEDALDAIAHHYLAPYRA